MDTPISFDAIRRIRPLRITLESVGPFESPFKVSLISPAGEPANFVMLASPNALGKTTILAALAQLYRCLENFAGRFDVLDVGRRSGSIQLDAIADVQVGDRILFVNVCVWCGERQLNSQVPDLSSSLQDEIETQIGDGFPSRAVLGFKSGATAASTDELGELFLDVVDRGLGRSPESLFDTQIRSPVAIFFTANRRILPPSVGVPELVRPPDIGYSPLQIVEEEGADWSTSIHNLIAYLFWQSEERFEILQDLVEASVFLDDDRRKSLDHIDRENFHPRLKDQSGQLLGIEELSHGERALFQILVRTATHMTGSTLLLIDEIDLHLHPNWRIKLLQNLKKLVVERAISVIFTTHSTEVIDAFAIEDEETGIEKGGHIIEREELVSGQSGSG